MAVSRDEAASLQRSVLETVGDAPAEWPGGYPEEIEAALIDAAYSVRARYGNPEKKTGVYGAVWRWRENRGWAADDLNVLARTDPDALAGITNHARLAGRSKAEVVIEAARALCEAGVVHTADLRANPDVARLVGPAAKPPAVYHRQERVDDFISGPACRSGCTSVSQVLLAPATDR